MPNVGKPSKGCKNCRDRKTKCDQKRPSCSQCIRAGKECHGYRDILSTMFKNESDVVAKKAEKRYEELAKQKAQPRTRIEEEQTLGYSSSERLAFTNDCPSTSSTELAPWTRYSTLESMTQEIVPAIEDQAQCFFLAHYVAQPSIVPRGQFEFVTELLSRPDSEEILQNSVKATSLAGLAIASKSPAIMQKAQAAYVNALRTTNSALRVKETAVKDSTLVSVILLGLYENMVFQGKHSVQAWTKHVAGACALLKFRGKDQFKSNLARRIFHQFFGIVLLVALETGTAVHDGMHELYEALHPASDYEIHGRQWTTRLVKVMHDAINLNKDKQSDPVTMVHTALKIDRELERIKALMPSIWQYKTVAVQSEYHHGNCYHLYADPWIIYMWNSLRSCRMHLYKILRENMARGCEHNPPLFPLDEIKPQEEAAEQIVRATAEGVIASVPQITGMVPFPHPSRLIPNKSLASEVKDHAEMYILHPPGTFLGPTRSAMMVHLIWPLYAAGQSDLSSHEMRQWCIEMLYYIALKIGTRQAVVLAEELKDISSRSMSPICHTTTYTFMQPTSCYT